MEVLKTELISKDAKLDEMNNEIEKLKSKLQESESKLDNTEQNERRVTFIVSGHLLSPKTRQENPVDVVRSVFRDNLKINMTEHNVNVVHRIGPVNSQRARPIIVKLVNRSMKYDLVDACLQLKPGFYNSESLPK